MVVETVHLPHHPLGLVVLVLRVVPLDELAAHLLGPQRLGLAHEVVVDHRVGGVEDGLRRPVVLIEHDHRRVGERILELEDVANVRTSKAVHRLVAVAHDADVAVLLGQEDDELVLGAVRVLELIDEDVSEPVLVVAEDVGVGLQQLHGHHQQVVEVHGVGVLQPPLVLAERVADAPFEDRARPFGVGIGIDELVLGRAERGVDRGGRESLRVDVEIAQHVVGQADGVGLVVDGERRRVPESVGVAAEDAHARRVERRHPHLRRHRSDEPGDATLHLVGRLVGERDGEDGEGGHAQLAHQIGDAIGQDARLARPGAGNNEQRSALVGDGLTLDRVEIVEQRRSALLLAHSHSMVPGGFDVMSSATRLTPGTSLISRLEMRSRTS